MHLMRRNGNFQTRNAKRSQRVRDMTVRSEELFSPP